MSLSHLVNHIQDAERGEDASSSTQANSKQQKLNGPLAYAGVKQVAPTNPQRLMASSSARAGVSSSSPLCSIPHSTPGSSTPMGGNVSTSEPYQETDNTARSVVQGIKQNSYFQLPQPQFSLEPQQYKERKKKTADRWAERLPELVHSYMTWRKETRYGKEEACMDEAVCSCPGDYQPSNILIISFDCEFLFKILYDCNTLSEHFSSGSRVLKVRHCPAHPLTPRLVKMGYFPSAPLHPWLAFNNSLMLFSSALFLNTVPNITGFMETIVAHPKLRSYNTPSAVSNPLPNMIVLTLHQESL